MASKTNDKRSVLMLVVSMLVFGTIGIFRRYIPLSSAFLAFARGILGGVFLLVFMMVRKKRAAKKLPARYVLWFILTGALIGINWILLFEAYNYTTVAVATLCYYMQPTIVMLVSPFLFHEKLTGKKAVCAVIAIIGMVFVSGVINDGSSQGGDIRGIVLGLGAAVFYSAVVIMNNKIRGIDAYLRTTIQLLSAGAVMIPYLLVTDGFYIEEISTQAIILVLTVGIVHTGIAYVLYFGSMEGLRVQSIALLRYIDPVSALLFSAFLLREPLTLLNVAGAVMIIGSAIISELHSGTSSE